MFHKSNKLHNLSVFLYNWLTANILVASNRSFLVHLCLLLQRSEQVQRGCQLASRCTDDPRKDTRWGSPSGEFDLICVLSIPESLLNFAFYQHFSPSPCFHSCRYVQLQLTCVLISQYKTQRGYTAFPFLGHNSPICCFNSTSRLSIWHIL